MPGSLRDATRRLCICVGQPTALARLAVCRAKIKRHKERLIQWQRQYRELLANGKCDVLKGQCIRSNAGLYYSGRDEFVETLRAIERNRNHEVPQDVAACSRNQVRLRQRDNEIRTPELPAIW